MPEELKLVECLARAGGKVPFTVKVSTAGGEYQQGHVLEIGKIGVSTKAGHEGELTYDFYNRITGTEHRLWRHDSSARFILESCCDDLPELSDELQQAIEEGDFCEQKIVEKIVKLLLKEITKSRQTGRVSSSQPAKLTV